MLITTQRQDLAARNVLLTRIEACKIADFGLSRKLGEDDDIYVSRVCVTVNII